VDAGQSVINGTALFSMSDLDRLLARVHVPAKEFRNIRTDQPVDLVLDATGERLTGRIKLVSPVVDSQSGTVKVTVEVPQHPSSVRPGDFAEVQIVTAQHEQRAVPAPTSSPTAAIRSSSWPRTAWPRDGW
jgi:multidrug efflux pump subunit AcrA (membrane-fusion protein)